MPAKTLRTTAIASVTTLMLAWALGGCAVAEPGAGGSATPEAEAEATVEPAVQTEPTEDPEATQESAETGGTVGDIPLPEGHMVIDEQTDEDTGAETLLVHVPGEFEDHADFYREALPAAGWTIESDEPTQGGFGRQFEATNGTDRVWIQCETFDAGTAIFISTAPLDAAGEEPGTQAADVELPDGFPADVFLPVYSPSTMMTGAGHGDGMWVLEYVASTDIPSVTAVIDQEIADKGWTVLDQAPEGSGTMYELTKSGYELILVVIPERDNETDTSLHYTLRTQ